MNERCVLLISREEEYNDDDPQTRKHTRNPTPKPWGRHRTPASVFFVFVIFTTGGGHNKGSADIRCSPHKTTAGVTRTMHDFCFFFLLFLSLVLYLKRVEIYQ